MLREIRREFDAEDIPYEEPKESAGGERRTLIQGYYEQMDFADPVDARRFFNVLAAFMEKIERQVREETPLGQGK